MVKNSYFKLYSHQVHRRIRHSLAFIWHRQKLQPSVPRKKWDIRLSDVTFIKFDAILMQFVEDIKHHFKVKNKPNDLRALLLAIIKPTWSALASPFSEGLPFFPLAAFCMTKMTNIHTTTILTDSLKRNLMFSILLRIDLLTDSWAKHYACNAQSND